MELKINQWKEFKVSEIFKKTKIKKYSSIPKETGNFPFISSKSDNNGVVKFCKPDYKKSILKNAITVSTNGANFDCFYHKYEFVAGSDIEVLHSNKLNENRAIFICTVLKKNQKKYSYANKAKNNAVFDTMIKLPATIDGYPDWEYMEKYIEFLLKDQKQINQLSKPCNNNKITLNISSWNKFKIGDLFQIYSSKNCLDQNKIIINDNLERKYNYITRKDTNNGIHSKICMQLTKINFGNCLTIGLDTQTIFYQSDDFYTGQNIHILRINNGNKYHYFFLMSILRKKIKELYSWGGNGLTLSRLKNNVIQLPTNNEGDPDWEYMEQYIKSLPYSKYL